MKVRSLGYRTDLMFTAFDGEIMDRGEYLVVRTPSNPGFYWGNYLLFADPPRPEDYERWRSLFAEEIGTPPQTSHQSFGWDTTSDVRGSIQTFLDAGFRFNHFQVLTARQIHPPRNVASGVTVRPLATDREWEQALTNQVEWREAGSEEAEYRIFRERQMERYRTMSSAGLGAWFGAFEGRDLVADLGLFHDEKLGRYQAVQTHPDRRRRGIGGTMVFEAARYALANFAVETLVIVADAGSPAARLYGSLGFRPTEHQLGLEWSGQSEEGTADES